MKPCLTVHQAKILLQNGENPIIKSRVYGTNNINNYRLERSIALRLSNGLEIVIRQGYVWDLASVPRLFWSIVPPDNDAELAFLIHDYLYENKIISKEFADNEMRIWCKELNGTANFLSLRNLDNRIRFEAVHYFGKKAWDKK